MPSHNQDHIRALQQQQTAEGVQPDPFELAALEVAVFVELVNAPSPRVTCLREVDESQNKRNDSCEEQRVLHDPPRRVVGSHTTCERGECCAEKGSLS